MKKRAFKISVPLIALAALAYLIFSPARTVGYSPDQPIPFNHKIHAGDNKIDCKYCHTGVETSANATVPPTSTCMNCHTMVASQKPVIKELSKKYYDKTPIEWVRVHDLPDHVHFNHSRHISRGVDCSQCHGNVAEMEKVKQVKSLNMGFCVQCHRENNVPHDCSTCHR